MPVQNFAQDTDAEMPGIYAGSDFSGGEGTETSPYLISNVEDLAKLDEWATAEKTGGRYFKLTNDITETPFKGMIASKGVFEGIFDGDNHCITVETDFPETSCVGFIGFMLGATVKNLQIAGTVNGNLYVGGVVGQAANGSKIENVINYASVNGSMFVGGVIGQLITQKDCIPCVVRQTANYGTVTAKYCGGVIGDMGQQVGNKVEHIVNYGHINGDKKSGGLIANARPYDSVYYGFNFGTSENNLPLGCIGNTKSSTIGDLYYDAQTFNIYKKNETQLKLTDDLIGVNMMNNEEGSGFSDKFWLYAIDMYPRPIMNGMENFTIPVLYATPVVLEKDNTLNNITRPFIVGTENGVVWSSKNGNIQFNGNKAYPVKQGDDVISVSLNGKSRDIKVKVIDCLGIDDVLASGSNTVTTSEGSIVITLSDDADVQIADVSGSNVINHSLQAGSHSYAVKSGIYVVRINNDVYKVCVNN